MDKKYALNRKLRIKMIPKPLIFKDPGKLLLSGAVARALPYTQLRYAALMQMYDLIKRVTQEETEGSIVEMGCGRGGCGAFMAYSAERFKSAREVWLFDSFEGLSEPVQKDIENSTKDPERIRKGYLAIGKEVAKEAITSMGLKHPERVHIERGWFEDSLPSVKEKLGTIAILRLDADLYEPTKYCLEELWDQVADDGYIVIDDYKNWIGCRRALYEFFHTRGVNPYIEHYPYKGKVFFKKTPS